MLPPKKSSLSLLQLTSFSLPFLTIVLSSSGIGGGTGSPETFFTEPKRGGKLQSKFAFYAFLLINYMDLVLATYNRLSRASLRASHSGLALISVYNTRLIHENAPVKRKITEGKITGRSYHHI
jgi:hypothetical protein